MTGTWGQRCGDCRHFMPGPDVEWRGSCFIKLPPWLIRNMVDDEDTLVTADDGCDLHDRE